MILGILTALLGGAALLGWWLDSSLLIRVSGHFPAMVPNTAVGLALSAFSMETMRRVPAHNGVMLLLSRASALFVIILGIATLLQYIIARDLGIDRLLFEIAPPRYADPGRPSPETALNFMSIGFALILINSSRWLWLAQLLAGVILGIALVALTGYLSGATMLYSFLSPDPVTGMALHTSLGFTFLAFALVLLRVTSRFTKIIVSTTSGGIMARRLIITIILLPATLGVLVSTLENFGIIDSSLKFAFSIIGTMGVFLALTWTTALKVDQLESERTNLFRETRENERRLTGVLQALPVGVWITNREGKIVMGNRAGQEIWRGARYVPPEHYGDYKGWWYDSGKPIQAHEWALARAVQKGEESVGELVRIQCFDGTQKIIINSALPLRDEEGGIAGAIVVNVDVSEHTRLERQQRFLASAGRVLLESLDYATVLKRIAKLVVPEVADWCVIFSVTTEEELKISAVEYRESALKPLAQKLSRSIKPNPENTAGILASIRSRQPILNFEVTSEQRQAVAQNEEHLHFLEKTLRSYVIFPLIARERSIGVIFLANGESGRQFDQTDLAYLEELSRRSAISIDNAMLLQSERQAVRLREEVLAFVSHDLKNPLSAIKMATKVLEHKYVATVEGDSESPKRLLSTLTSSTERMEQLISELLDFAKLRAHGFRLEYGSTDIAELIDEIYEFFTPLAIDKKISISKLIPEFLPPIEADRRQLHRVLSNLVGNALKFTSKGGKVGISAKSKNGNLRFEIRDTGPGIESSDLKQLFERFWQSPKTAKQGTGLGLAIAKEIVTAHGGTIGVESEVGKGSIFYFEIPKRPSKTMTGEAGAA